MIDFTQNNTLEGKQLFFIELITDFCPEMQYGEAQATRFDDRDLFKKIDKVFKHLISVGEVYSITFIPEKPSRDKNNLDKNNLGRNNLLRIFVIMASKNESDPSLQNLPETNLKTLEDFIKQLNISFDDVFKLYYMRSLSPVNMAHFYQHVMMEANGNRIFSYFADGEPLWWHTNMFIYDKAVADRDAMALEEDMDGFFEDAYKHKRRLEALKKLSSQSGGGDDIVP